MKLDVNSFKGAPYQTKRDAARLFLELVFGLMVVSNVFVELYEIYEVRKRQALIMYFKDVWNVLDWASMLLFIAVFFKWGLGLVPLSSIFQSRL